MILQVYNTFTGLQEDAVVAPGDAGGVKPDTVTKFAPEFNVADDKDGPAVFFDGRNVTVTGFPADAAADALIPHGITARSVPLSPDGVHGDSGSVRLNLSGRLEVRDAGEILVDTRGSGRGGNIAINTNELLVSSGGIVAARTFALEGGGSGGNVAASSTSAFRPTSTEAARKASLVSARSCS